MKLSTHLSILALVLPLVTTAQTEKGTKKNEIGTDITALIEQVLNFNKTEFTSPYSATYQITYKRHFKGFSARIGVGGRTASQDVDDDFSDEVFKKIDRRINYRIGVEKPVELSKRWNFYYGLDFRHSITQARNDFHYQNGGWRYGSDTKGSTISISPLFGLEFRITDKIALQTEANFLAYFYKSSKQPIITQITENPSDEMPSTDLEETKIRGTAFNVPDFLVLTIKL